MNCIWTSCQFQNFWLRYLMTCEFALNLIPMHHSITKWYDYEDDVMNNTFNILRMFAAIYGPLEAPNMLAKCIGEAEEKYESFSKKLDPSLSGSYWRRCEEATKEGGKTSGHAYGTWNIPRVISNEDAFRRERRSKHDACAVIT
ncbi:hypothetical protein ZEAMMB73_Zm00001d003491 [Zea mays]|nr:hypothetical protein ZEAMMB73_Zm00001d003491 [Zea mays]